MFKKFYRILLITLVIILTLFSFTMNSFATIITNDPYQDILTNNEVYSKIMDYCNSNLNTDYYANPNYFILFNCSKDEISYNGVNCYYAVYYNTGIISKVGFSNVSNKLYLAFQRDMSNMGVDSFVVDCSFFDINGNFVKTNSFNCNGYRCFDIYPHTNSTNYVYSNVLLYDESTEPPTLINPLQPPVEKGIILEGVEQIPQTIVETIKKIIPIGLVIFSILLVIFLVRYVVYRML